MFALNLHKTVPYCMIWAALGLHLTQLTIQIECKTRRNVRLPLFCIFYLRFCKKKKSRGSTWIGSFYISYTCYSTRITLIFAQRNCRVLYADLSDIDNFFFIVLCLDQYTFGTITSCLDWIPFGMPRPSGFIVCDYIPFHMCIVYSDKHMFGFQTPITVSL